MSFYKTHDIIIVGGGACGCTTAYFLCDEGLNVAIVDKGEIGQEASWASAGMVGPSSLPSVNPWHLKSTTLSKILYDNLNNQLFEETGHRIGYGGEGALILAEDEEEIKAVLLEIQSQVTGKVSARFLTSDEVHEREPTIPKTISGAAWMSDSRYLDARTYYYRWPSLHKRRGLLYIKGGQSQV